MKFINISRKQFKLPNLKPLGWFIVLAAFTSVSAFAVDRVIKYIKAVAYNATLSIIPETAGSAYLGSNYTVSVTLNTDNAKIRGTDIKIHFDQTKLKLVSILPIANQNGANTSLKTFLPLNESNQFDSNTVIDSANRNGDISFTALTADMAQGNLTAVFSGTTTIAKLVFSPQITGITNLNLYFTQGQTTDSNIALDQMPPEDILAKVNNLTVDIAMPIGPTATPTPTVAPTSTVRPTSTPTSTPSNIPTVKPTVVPTIKPSATATPTTKPANTPIPTPVPTSVPSSGSNTITVRVNSRSNDANQDGPEVVTSSSQIWLGNGESTEQSLTGVRFESVGIPKGAKIKSAYVRVYSVTTQWINIDMSMAAEIPGNGETFSRSSRLSGRTLTNAKVNHSSNVKWAGGKWYNLNDIASVIQEVVDRSDWQTNQSLTIIMKGTGRAYGRKMVGAYESGENKTIQLVVSYDNP